MHPAEIKAALAVAGYKQVTLAGEMKLGSNTIGAVIHGRSRSAQVEARIAEITRLPPETLWPQWYGVQPLTLSAEERELVLAYRAAPSASRRKARRDLGAVAPPDDSTHHVRADRGGIAAGRDVTLHDPKPQRYRRK